VINRGLVAQQTVEAIHRRMLAVIEGEGGRITAVRFCPHRPDEACPCRKPRPGMLQRLVAEYQIDPFAAYMVGDALSDIAAGHAVGCRTILVQMDADVGVAQRGATEQHQQPDRVVASLLEAAHWIRHQSH
ncbi:MAG: HAD-IIIA family hydrolase, partial [Chloroflexales bacterium]